MVFIYHDGRMGVTVRLLGVAWDHPVRELTAAYSNASAASALSLLP
jgi:hypothetical protein